MITQPPPIEGARGILPHSLNKALQAPTFVRGCAIPITVTHFAKKIQQEQESRFKDRFFAVSTVV